ncbi:antitrypsin-like [Haematobia irritans]|uniref:antitrypsin-like n=1 Tax=Haematobia irritans TaxID=7368 RepID=UPI003F50401C
MRIDVKIPTLLCIVVIHLTGLEANNAAFHISLDNFSRRVFDEVIRENNNENVIISPFSIEACLGMIRLGVEGETAIQMDRSLNIKVHNPHAIGDKFHSVLSKYKDNKIISFANKVYVAVQNEINEDFQEMLSTKFYSNAQNIDFSDNDNASDTINDWVSSETNGMINEIISPYDLDENTLLVLMSAISFNGKWKTAFDKVLTQEDDFYVDENTAIKVPMMQTQSTFTYGNLKDLEASAILLPYSDCDLAMLIILPDAIGGLQKLLHHLKALDLASLVRRRVNQSIKAEVRLPKFTADFKIELSDILKKLGMDKLFISGDFGKMLKVPQALAVSQVIHQATLEVNEEGTNAASTSDKTTLMAGMIVLLLATFACAANEAEFHIGLGTFSQNLFHELYNSYSTENIVYSPFSIQSCLAMMRMGAAGDTAKEMDKGLSFTGQTPENIANNYNHLLAKYETGTLLKVANKVYIMEHNELQDSFSKILTDKFFSTPEKVDFEHANDAAKTINTWVETKTNNKINNFIKPSALGADTRLVLVSAIYFKGVWEIPFPQDYTEDREFFLDESKNVKVPTMTTEGAFEHAAITDIESHAVRMRYKNSDLSMIIILPDSRTGLNSMNDKLQNFSLQSLKSLFKTKKVEITMPKFQVEFEIELKDTLTKMGMKEMFNRADFSKAIKESEPLYITSAIHKTFISVNEVGTEATGVTGIVATSRSLPHFFTVDHPFYYAIVNDDFVPLFQGTIVHF